MEGGDQGKGGGTEMMRERERPKRRRKKRKTRAIGGLLFFYAGYGLEGLVDVGRFNIVSEIMFPIPQIQQDY